MEGNPVDEATLKSTVEIVVVTSPACHFCEEALVALEGLSAEFPVDVRVVDIRSDEGAEVVRVHRPPMPPAVLVDGELFSFGKLPRKKLRRYLENWTRT